jgi:hypothetical protein
MFLHPLLGENVRVGFLTLDDVVFLLQTIRNIGLSTRIEQLIFSPETMEYDDETTSLLHRY